MNWYTTHTQSHGLSKRIAAHVSGFMGSMKFVYIHVAWFSLWILFGVEPFPFGLLTMVVSLEAIFLSTFVMINANDSAERDRANAEADYETNLKAKNEIEDIIKKLDSIESQKLDKILLLVSKKHNE